MKPADFIHSEDAATLQQMENISGFVSLMNNEQAKGLNTNLKY